MDNKRRPCLTDPEEARYMTASQMNLLLAHHHADADKTAATTTSPEPAGEPDVRVHGGTASPRNAAVAAAAAAPAGARASFCDLALIWTAMNVGARKEQTLTGGS